MIMKSKLIWIVLRTNRWVIGLQNHLSPIMQFNFLQIMKDREWLDLKGIFFSKIRSDSLVELNYSYCSALFCEDFGNILNEPTPSSIVVYNKQHTEVELTEHVVFCLNDDETALFYHNMEEMAVGKLYMKINGLYLEAVSVFYDIGAHQEIENILKTIKSD